MENHQDQKIIYEAGGERANLCATCDMEFKDNEAYKKHYKTLFH